MDLRTLSGTGPGGRIIKADIARAHADPNPPIVILQSEILERIPLKGVRAIIAERMATSVHTTARVTLVTEVDATSSSLPECASRKRLKRIGASPGLQRPAGHDCGCSRFAASRT